MDCFALLLNGNIFGAAVCPFNNIPEFGQWFYLIVVLSLEVAIYFKTQDATMPTIIGIVLGIVMAGMLPTQFFTAAISLMAINMAVVFYKIYTNKGS